MFTVLFKVWEAPGMLRPGQDTASFLNDIPGASVPVGAAIPAMGRNVTLALQARF
jgi:hypothetical protein